MPQSGHQTEAIDLNEGKTAPQMFASDCAVCHQKPNGLAKGRNTGQLANFLRQHYTTGTQQAGMIAAYLTSDGFDRGARERGPVDRPPALIGRRQSPDAGDPDADAAPNEGRRKPAAEAGKPAERDAPASRRHSRERDEGRKPSERKPAATARGPKSAPEIKQIEEPAASTAASETPAEAAPAAPPAEEKPAAPPPPPAPEIRI